MKVKIVLTMMLSFLVTACFILSNDKVIKIGTGSTAGIYYPTGKEIASLLETILNEENVKVDYISTGGSVYNIHAVLSGDMDFGIAQSDKQYLAWNGFGEWEKKGPQKKLRSIFSIHPESVLLIASQESGIYKTIDLVGKKVNLGNPGSGQLGNAMDVLEAYGLSEKNIIPEYLNASEATERFLKNRIDAFFYTIGNPNDVVLDIVKKNKKINIVPLDSVSISRLVDKYSYYVEVEIPQKIYPQVLNMDLKTFGVKATLVTSSDVDEHLVYLLTKAVFDNFEKFKKSHPSHENLTIENCLMGLTAPIHAGALKYYNEKNLTRFIPSELIKE